MDKQIAMSIYDGLPLSYIKEHIIDLYNYLDKFQRHYAE